MALGRASATMCVTSPAVQDVDRQENDAGLRARQKQIDELDAILQIHRKAVAWDESRAPAATAPRACCVDRCRQRCRCGRRTRAPADPRATRTTGPQSSGRVTRPL
jgi:hypothetical protein